MIQTVLYWGTCNQTFEREQELLSYIEKECSLDVSTERWVVLLQTDMCGACTNQVITFILQEMHCDSIPVLVLFSSHNEQLLRRICHNEGNLQCHVAVNYNFERYGIRYTDDMLFLISESKIREYYRLSQDRLRSIRKKFPKC